MFLFKTHSAGVAKIGNPHVLVYNDSVDLEYLRSGIHSDITLHCGYEKIKAHKVFLARCHGFPRAVLESATTLDVNGFQPWELRPLLKHLYNPRTTWENLEFRNLHPLESNPDMLVRIAQIAAFHQVPDLVGAAIERLRRYLRASNPTVGVPGSAKINGNILWAFRSAWSKERRAFTNEKIRTILIEFYRQHRDKMHSFATFCAAIKDIGDPELLYRYVRLLLLGMRAGAHLRSTRCDTRSSLIPGSPMA